MNGRVDFKEIEASKEKKLNSDLNTNKKLIEQILFYLSKNFYRKFIFFKKKIINISINISGINGPETNEIKNREKNI